VSGVAALLASQPQFNTAAGLRAALEGAALDLGAAGWDAEYGFGLVQAQAALTFTFSLSSAVTPPPTGEPLPTDVPAAAPAAPEVSILAAEGLWGTAQTCSAALANAGNSVDLAFNDAVAQCTSDFGNNRTWTYTAFQPTALGLIQSATLDVRMMVSGWADDRLDLELSLNGGGTWMRLARFEAANPPPAALTTLSYALTGILTTPAQARQVQVRVRGTAVVNTAELITLALDEARLNLADALPTPTALPLRATPAAPAPQPTLVPAVGDPHVNYTALTDSCAACHRGHTASSASLRAAAPEEAVCYTCHLPGSSGTAVQAAFTSYTNSATAYYKHDVAQTNGVHRPGQSLPADFGGAARHVECEDCHDPHEATRGAAAAPFVQRELNAVAGVDPIWTGAGGAAGYTWLAQAEREYQVCFKCHSAYTILPSYAPAGWNGSAVTANGLAKLTSANAAQAPDSRDLAREFNPYNASYHPVAAAGRNTSIPAGSFVAGWSVNSQVYCSSCHTNANAAAQGSGPHGSPQLHILNGTAQYTTVDTGNNPRPTAGELCFQCHQYNTYASNANNTLTTIFRDGNNNLHELHVAGERAPCYTCHDSHGSEQYFLMNFDTAAVTINAGYNSQTAYVRTATAGTCYIACHGTQHGNGFTYRP
ncbi:MAG: hypothetical protein KA764_20910, partial [Anaerolineales bacterium]|nr:hypothetical protein [Anaerolineales bacterium]